MTHEKTFMLETGRTVKVIATRAIASDQVETEIEVLIKEPREDDFRLPIGTTHPKYWKLKKLDLKKSRALQIQYSGLTEKQIKEAVNEFKRLRANAKTSF